MKKTLIIIVTIFILMGITGCNNTANNSNGNTGQSTDTNEDTAHNESTREDDGKISKKEYKKLIQMQKEYNDKELYTSIFYDHNKNEIDMISVGNESDMFRTGALFYLYDTESNNFYLVDAEVSNSYYVYNANEDRVYYLDDKEIEKGYHTLSDYNYKPARDGDINSTRLLSGFRDGYNRFIEKYQIDDISEVEYYLEKRLAARLQYGPYAPEGEKQEE